MTKDVLLKQFTSCYDRNGWFVATRNTVEGITAEQAAWKPAGSDNSIWESLSHITYYAHAYVQRFKGIEYEYENYDNDATFSAGELNDEAWQADLAKFDQVMNEWRSLIEQADESKFSEPVPTKPERTWSDVLADFNAHNAYHGGQILLLRKLQGTWNPEKGVS